MKSEIQLLLMVVGACCAATGGLAQTLPATAPGNTTAAATTPAPKIQFAEPTFDFGTITTGTVVHHAFVFTNTGTAPLVVTDAMPSCDCTTVQKLPAPAEPGQTGAIAIEFDSTGFDGDVTEAIAVATNEPNQPQTVLTFKANVSGPIKVSPSHVIFTPVAGAQTSATKIIRITNRTTEPLTLSAPESSNHTFAAELKTVRAEKEFELLITTVPPFASGTVRGNITIKTNLPNTPAISVQAVAVVQQRK